MRNKIFSAILVVIALASCAYSQEAPDLQVTSVNVSGNEHITSAYILGIVDTKPGTVLKRETIQHDVDTIYAQGYFQYADFDVQFEGTGVAVTFNVRENEVISSITFEGCTIYSQEELMQEVFSQVGHVFNREFFRHDLNRIQDKYHQDGYIMVRTDDVSISGGDIRVRIVEPVIGDIIIQGNKKTKTYVIRREIKAEKGDVYNAIRFNHDLRKVQNLDYFEDVTSDFEFTDNTGTEVDIILTVREKRTASIGINLAYGTESGVSGGLTYSNTNIFGRGMNFEIGFNEGDEASYWATFASPYMDAKTFAWRVGARYYTYDDRYYYYRGRRQFDFDERRVSFFAGVGKKFSNEDWSWFLTFRHEKAEYDDVHNAIPGYIDDITMWDGTNQTIELNLTWDKRDDYVPYPKGYVWETNIEQAIEVLGGEYDYLKYWTQARIYLPLNNVFSTLFDANFPWNASNPLLLAVRLRVGSATDDSLPSFARYSLGGMNTLRGYNTRSFEGSNVYLGNAEVRMPLLSMLTLVGFYDIGNAADEMDWDDYHDNWGIGVRVKTPFGSMRIDYAYGEDENRTYFGFGEMF